MQLYLCTLKLGYLNRSNTDTAGTRVNEYCLGYVRVDANGFEGELYHTSCSRIWARSHRPYKAVEKTRGSVETTCAIVSNHYRC